MGIRKNKKGDGRDRRRKSAASASQTASESLSIRASVYYERTGHDRRGRTD
ncbi:MAG: hypothetical protein SOH58_08065 [Olsenella sp.]|jgi:hypothetical protein